MVRSITPHRTSPHALMSCIWPVSTYLWLPPPQGTKFKCRPELLQALGSGSGCTTLSRQRVPQGGVAIVAVSDSWA